MANGVSVRVWAGSNNRVELVVYAGNDSAPTGCQELEPEVDGYFSTVVPEGRAGTLYAFRLNGQPPTRSDPASRFQPQGPLGPSEVIDPTGFAWTDAGWRGVSPQGQVLYEMHIGTFTPEGTYRAAAEQVPELARLGVTVIELMPVGDFVGQFGWGYDGVNLFAPCRLYGRPDDLRHFVDRAHAAGIGVLLDVVYNHLGPMGQCLDCFSEDYFTDRYKTEWGQAMNFDGPRSGPVREYFLANAGYWIDEFHMDGLRLDATQNIYDHSGQHILAAVAERVRSVANGRGTLLVGENEPQNARLLRPPEQGGYGLDMLWNDDFHHEAQVVLGGRREAYYTDYGGTPQEFVSAAKYGFIYQGQRYKWQHKRRGTPVFDLPARAFVNYIENHDQMANSAHALHSHARSSPGRYRAMTALQLLAPGTPLLFQGQEFGASAPFYYFADQPGEVGQMVRAGRMKFLEQFPSISQPATQRVLADPSAPATFEACKLDFSERHKHLAIYTLHQDLLRLRRERLGPDRLQRNRMDGAVIGPEAFVLRFFGSADDDLLLVVNFGVELHLDPAPEPLLAPPVDRQWREAWSSEDPAYGGAGTPPLESAENWRIPAQAAVLLATDHPQ